MSSTFKKTKFLISASKKNHNSGQAIGPVSRRSNQPRPNNVAFLTDSDSNESLLVTKRINAKSAKSKAANHPTCRYLKIATLNTRTFDDKKLYQLAIGCNQHGIDVIGIQEHRKKTETAVEYTLVESKAKGKIENGLLIRSSANAQGMGGIGIYLTQRAKERFLSCEPISERILLVQLGGKPAITIVVTYAPTESYSDESKEAFYGQLNDTIANVPPHNFLVVAADFNARLGLDSHQSSPLAVGPHIYHDESNNNGKLLTELCATNKLYSAQSKFPNRKGRKWTWRHPAGTKAQLDHILVRTKWINSLRNCRAYHTLSLESDHRMVCATTKLSLRQEPKATPNKRPIDWSKLLDPTKQAKFELDLKNHFQVLDDDTEHTDVQRSYDNLLRAIDKSTKDNLGTIARPRQKHWASQRSVELIQAKEKAKLNLESLENAKTTRNGAKRLQDAHDQLKRLANETTMSLEDDEVKHLESQLEELREADRQKQARKTWQIIRRISGSDKKAIVKVKSTKDSEEGVLDEWRSYFEQLLNAKPKQPPPEAHAIITNCVIPKFDTTKYEFDTTDFKLSEVQIAIAALKNNKAPGSDDVVTAELLKNGGSFIASTLLSLCNAIMSGADPPWQWTTNKIVPIPKKGDISLMTNYRGISLMSTGAKIYNRLLLNRLRPIIDTVLRNNQAGFRQGRSTVGQICALRRIFEGAQHKQLPLVATFVDFKKAFDSVNREAMFNIMRGYRIPERLVKATKKMYDNSKAVVSINGKNSNSFDITTGVLQGDVLAPFLFILVIDYVMRNCESTHGFTYKPGSTTRHPPHLINDLDFADDIVLLENLISIANDQIQKLNDEALKIGLEINIDKTEVMLFNQKENGKVNLNNIPLKTVVDFKYLGAHMASTALDFEHRNGQAWSAYNKLRKIWEAQHIPINLKVNIFQASVISILLYGCESWIVDATLEARINSFAMNCYRSFLNVKRLDHITNKEILRRVNMPPLINVVRQRQLGWLGHTLRMAPSEPTHIFALYEPSHGTYRRGPHPLTYKKQIAKLYCDSPDDLTVAHLAEKAKDKEKWNNWSKAVAALGRT